MQIFKRIFGKCNLRTAIDFAVLRKRSKWWGGMECRTLFGVAGFALK